MISFPLRWFLLAGLACTTRCAFAATETGSVRLVVEVRGQEGAALQVGDPLRVAVAVLPSEGKGKASLTLPSGVPWTAAVRVRLHRLDGVALGAPARARVPAEPSSIAFTVAAPAVGLWRWPAEATADLPPGDYRVSARVLAPKDADGKTPPPLAVAETRFTLAAAPTAMTAAQRTHWHHLLAMDAFLAGDRARAQRLNSAVLASEPTNREARQLEAALARPPPAALAVGSRTAAAPPVAAPVRTAEPGPTPASRSATLPPADAAPRTETGGSLHWATSARASSEYRTTDYSAARATGAPDVSRHADSGKAWAAKQPDGGEEWMELTYASPMRASGVRVIQSFNPGAVMKIELIAEDGSVSPVWTGPDGTPYAKNAIGTLEVKFPPTEKCIARVKLTLDTKRAEGWNEVDAVGLVTEGG